MRRLTAVLLASLALVACGDDDGSDDALPAIEGAEETEETEEAQAELGDPGETMESLIRMQFLGQFGRAWDDLHPEHQELVPRPDYEACQSGRMEELAGVTLDDFEVLETYEDRVTLPGGEVEATAITYEMTLSDGTDSQPVTDTSRLINVDGEWRWVLSDVDEYVNC